MKIMLFILYWGLSPTGERLIHINTHKYPSMIECELAAKNINDRHLIVNGEPVKARCFEKSLK